MKILPDLKALSIIPNPLLRAFVVRVSPWLTEIENWEPERWGYTFILSDSDIGHYAQLNIVPHLPADEGYHLDLPAYEDWEYANHDEQSGYYHAVALIGEEYGASIFMSENFVSSMPNLKKKLNQLLGKESSHVE